MFNTDMGLGKTWKWDIRMEEAKDGERHRNERDGGMRETGMR